MAKLKTNANLVYSLKLGDKTFFVKAENYESLKKSLLKKKLIPDSILQEPGYPYDKAIEVEDIDNEASGKRSGKFSAQVYKDVTKRALTWALDNAGFEAFVADLYEKNNKAIQAAYAANTKRDGFEKALAKKLPVLKSKPFGSTMATALFLLCHSEDTK